jgi:hypothetical protein
VVGILAANRRNGTVQCDLRQVSLVDIGHVLVSPSGVGCGASQRPVDVRPRSGEGWPGRVGVQAVMGSPERGGRGGSAPIPWADGPMVNGMEASFATNFKWPQ